MLELLSLESFHYFSTRNLSHLAFTLQQLLQIPPKFLTQLLLVQIALLMKDQKLEINLSSKQIVTLAKTQLSEMK